MKHLSFAFLAHCMVVMPYRPVLADEAAEIKKLIPAAAGLSLKDWDKLAKSTTAPDPADLESQTLTLILLTIRVADDERHRDQFRYLTERPLKPGQLAREITRFVRGRGRFRVALGPVTMIHEDRITHVTCNIEGDAAAGTVSFKVPDLYEGKVNYKAKQGEDNWRIDEFSIPAYKVHVIRTDEGKWIRANPATDR